MHQAGVGRSGENHRVPYRLAIHSGLQASGKRVALRGSALYPYGKLCISLVVNENGLYECRDHPNRHLRGCVGDAYIYTSFETNEDDEDVDEAMEWANA